MNINNFLSSHPIKVIALFLLFSSGFMAKGQTIEAVEGSFILDGRTTNALISTIEGDESAIKKRWTKYIRSETKIKLRKNNKYLEAKEVTLYPVTDKRGDFITLFFSEDGVSKMAVIYALGYDIYLNSTENPEEFEKLKILVNRFIFEHYQDYYEDMIDQRTKERKALVKQQRNAENLNSTSERNAKKLKRELKDDNPNKKLVEKQIEGYENLISSNSKFIEKIKENILKTDTDINTLKLNLLGINSRLNSLGKLGK